MDSELIYSVAGVVIFLAIAISVLRNKDVQSIQTKEEKLYEIINGYKKELRETLEPLQDDNKARMSKKTQMLKKFSDELAMNVLFDADEKKEIIQELAHV